jgi:hypothetical protein
MRVGRHEANIPRKGKQVPSRLLSRQITLPPGLRVLTRDSELPSVHRDGVVQLVDVPGVD